MSSDPRRPLLPPADAAGWTQRPYRGTPNALATILGVLTKPPTSVVGTGLSPEEEERARDAARRGVPTLVPGGTYAPIEAPRAGDPKRALNALLEPGTPGVHVPGMTPGQGAMRAMKAEVAAARAGAPEGERLRQAVRSVADDVPPPTGQDVSDVATSARQTRTNLRSIFEPEIPRDVTPTPLDDLLEVGVAGDNVSSGLRGTQRALPPAQQRAALPAGPDYPHVRMPNGEVVRAADEYSAKVGQKLVDQGKTPAALRNARGESVITGGSHMLSSDLDAGLARSALSPENQGYVNPQTGVWESRDETALRTGARKGESSEVLLAENEAANAEPLPLLEDEPAPRYSVVNEPGSATGRDWVLRDERGQEYVRFNSEQAARNYEEAVNELLDRAPNATFGERARIRERLVEHWGMDPDRAERLTERAAVRQARQEPARRSTAPQMRVRHEGVGAQGRDEWSVVDNEGRILHRSDEQGAQEWAEEMNIMLREAPSAEARRRLEYRRRMIEMGISPDESIELTYAARQGDVTQGPTPAPLKPGEPIPMGGLSEKYATPGTPEFTQLALDQHREWQAIDRIPARKRTPEQQEEFQRLDRALDEQLIAARGAGEPSPLGYPEHWSRLEAAFNESDMPSGTLEEWKAELRRVAPHGVSDSEIFETLERPTRGEASAVNWDVVKAPAAGGSYRLLDDMGEDYWRALESKIGEWERQGMEWGEDDVVKWMRNRIYENAGQGGLDRIPELRTAQTVRDWFTRGAIPYDKDLMSRRIQAAEREDRQIKEKSEQLLATERAKLEGQLEKLRSNPKIPEKVKLEKIADTQERLDNLSPVHFTEKAMYMVRRENAPRFSREEIERLIADNPMRIDVETRTDDPRVTAVTQGQYSPAQIAEAKANIDAARGDFQNKQGDANAKLTELESNLTAGHSPALREAIAGAADADEAVRAAQEVSDNFRTSTGAQPVPIDGARVRDVYNALIRMRDAHTRVDQYEAILNPTSSPSYRDYLTRYEDTDDDGYTINIYRLLDPSRMPKRYDRSTHFSESGEGEIGHLRRTAHDDETRTFLQEAQSDVAQGHQKKANLEPAPYVANKDWLDLMLRDQFMRAAVENRDDLILQPPEGAPNVSGGNDRPGDYYSDVAPHAFSRAAEATTGEKTGTARVDIGTPESSVPDDYELRNMAEVHVDEGEPSYLGGDFSDWYYQMFQGMNWRNRPDMEDAYKQWWRETEARQDELWDKRGAVDFAKQIKAGRVGGTPAAFDKWLVESAYDEIGSESEIDDALHDWHEEMLRIHHQFKGESTNPHYVAWREEFVDLLGEQEEMFVDGESGFDEGEAEDRIQQWVEEIRDELDEYRIEWLDDELADEAQEAYNKAREQAIENEMDYIRDNWEEYRGDGDMGTETVDVPHASIPLDALLALQKKGTYLLGPAAALAAGAAAEQQRRNKRN